jgi:ComF family protein
VQFAVPRPIAWPAVRPAAPAGLPPASFRAVRCCASEGALAAAVIRLKKAPDVPHRVAFLIDNANLPAEFASADLVVPIPLSRHRRLERGFNQAEIIAGLLSKRLKTPVDAQSLTRKLHTHIHRVGMDQKARELSVRNAFEVIRPKLITGKNILLVDDVFTSGATASSAAKVLKKNGAGNVWIFTLARAVMR